MNLSAWRKIENDIRKLAAHSDAVYILTGTLFDCGNIRHVGSGRIAVPCATYKVALALQGRTKSAFAVILANEPSAQRQDVSVREVEQRAGLDFFSALTPAEQDELESAVLSMR